MFRRFMVATDFSPASYTVVQSLEGLQAFHAQQCLLLHCLSLPGAVSASSSSRSESGDELLAEQKALLEEQGFTVETRIIAGSVKQEIKRIAAEEKYDLIVVGAQGQSLARERLLGGVAYAIISTSRKPVLVMPVTRASDNPDTCVLPSRCEFSRHVLLATDFSEMAYTAFIHVEQMAACGVRKVTLIHVQDQNDAKQHLKKRSAEINALDHNRLDNLRKTLLLRGVSEVDIEIRHGEPYVEITRVARDNNIHLVVMGTQGRGFLGKIILGSVSLNVARTSEVPVLLIPSVH
ncbi:universal stress protein [Desulfobulbus alkaliphilus]|uniref:universal stress protein n=1 Tax=Desulfobulbus alkaliphilus TaxID=869814 RepID=UPI001964604E|nr:universal stress protein [Desulfobulbus alkaliphilus]MBM9537926.1 universal stress protein [Desulfobulbus alkaliphilus]